MKTLWLVIYVWLDKSNKDASSQYLMYWHAL
jgi:hypothetical protein